MAQSAMTYQLAVKVSRQGLYLTELDWLKVDVSALCYDLEMLVFQPQHAEPSWERMPQMVHPWPHAVLVDLRQLSFKKETLSLQSTFNGQKHRVNWESWLSKAIHNLDYYWVMPQSDQLVPHVQSWLSQLPQHKILQPDVVETMPENWQLFEDKQSCFQQTADGQKTWLLADQVSQKSSDGWVLDKNDLYQITDSKWLLSTESLAENCQCEACERALQRCYFHHLLNSVPLLANRYLTLHNLYQLKFCT